MKSDVLSKLTDTILASIILEYKLIKRSVDSYKIIIFNNSSLLGKLLNSVIYLFRRLLKIKDLKDAMINVHKNNLVEPGYFGKISNSFRIRASHNEQALCSIPDKGPVIIYANHPFSGLDVFALASLIEKKRPDLKVLSASYLEHFPGFKAKSFSIKVDKKTKFKETNKLVYEKINEHLKAGKALIIFPSGKVSRITKQNKVFALDPPWQEGLVSFTRYAPETTYLPVFIEGEPSKAYLQVRRRSWFFSNFMIIREFANQINTEMSFNFGQCISHQMIEGLNIKQKVSYLRAKLYVMGTEYFKRAKSHVQHIGHQYDINYPLLSFEELSLMHQVDLYAFNNSELNSN